MNIRFKGPITNAQVNQQRSSLTLAAGRDLRV